MNVSYYLKNNMWSYMKKPSIYNDSKIFKRKMNPSYYIK